jgi:hypothetical protein
MATFDRGNKGIHNWLYAVVKVIDLLVYVSLLCPHQLRDKSFCLGKFIVFGCRRLGCIEDRFPS